MTSRISAGFWLLQHAALGWARPQGTRPGVPGFGHQLGSRFFSLASLFGPVGLIAMLFEAPGYREFQGVLRGF